MRQGGSVAEIIPKFQNRDSSKFSISELSNFQFMPLILKIHDNMDLYLSQSFFWDTKLGYIPVLDLCMEIILFWYDFLMQVHSNALLSFLKLVKKLSPFRRKMEDYFLHIEQTQVKQGIAL